MKEKKKGIERRACTHCHYVINKAHSEKAALSHSKRDKKKKL